MEAVKQGGCAVGIRVSSLSSSPSKGLLYLSTKLLFHTHSFAFGIDSGKKKFCLNVPLRLLLLLFVEKKKKLFCFQNKTHAVLAALKLSQDSDLSSYQKKVFKIDNHIGIAVSGLIADGRILSRYMRNECLNHKFVYESPLPVARLVRDVADRHQVATARSWKRPFGVGLLCIGHDQTGPHLFQTCPSGNYWEYYAIAMGARSQASKTYLEKKLEDFESSSLDDLVKHALRALEESCGTRKADDKDSKLTLQNCTVAIVGENKPLLILDGEDVKEYVDAIHQEQEATTATATTAAAAAEMSIDTSSDMPSGPAGEAGVQPPTDPTNESGGADTQPMEEG